MCHMRRYMKKLLLLILSCAMLLGGLYLAAFELFFARIISLRFIIGGALLALAGGYLIWTDFIAPKFSIKTWED